MENTWNSSGILGKLDLSLLQDTIIMRDRKSDGMNRCECITAIADLTGASYKESKQCYSYLIEKGYLPRLRGGGRVQKAHATTTKRLQITTISMRRWHNCLSAAYEEQLRLNRYDSEFMLKRDHFIGNVDKSCMMANEANMYVVGCKKASKSDKNTSDSQFSITTIWSGTCANASGPFLFLGTEKKMNNRALSDKNLVQKHGALPHSSFWLNSNGYMTDADWIITAHKLSKGL